MAEIMTVVTPLIDKLVELLVEEVKSSKRVHREIKSLKDELEIIQSFLKDADAAKKRGEMGDAVKTWVKQVREEADSIENVIDEYLFHVGPHHVQGKTGFIGSLYKAGNLIKDLKWRYKIASQIQNSKISLREIKDRGERYGLRPLEQGTSSRATTDVEGQDPRLGSLFLEEDELVGIDSTSKEIIRSLIEGTSARVMISLVGTGGIGKTTLAKNVYDNEAVEGHFDYRTWITVSQTGNLTRRLIVMARHIFPNVGEITGIEEVTSLLRNYLQTKRYLVVFDDVWQTNFWEVIKYAFPSNKKGSRIIITTRNDIIAASSKETSCDLVLKLQPLSEDMGLELFVKKAFQFEQERSCPLELKQLSHEIVKKCQGLPLVITAIAGILSTKEKNVSQWKNLLQNLNNEFESNPNLSSISNILALSYHDLPYHLKYCLLFFGIFPEDHLILDTRLYRLWIAEGFVKEKRHKTLEEVAEEYLNEPIYRNLVSCQEFYGLSRRCQVHDLMREIILSKFDDFGFCQIMDERKKRLQEKSRRISIYNSTKNVLEITYAVRSIYLFNVDELTNSFMVNLFQRFRLLKLLDFTNAPIDSLPKEVGNLFHLKYLRLCNTNVRMLSKSIGKLLNLQTLVLRNTPVQELPVEINKLRNLNHLLVFRCNPTAEHVSNLRIGMKIQEGISSLENLQTLTLVEANHNGIHFIQELQKLSQLRWLGISKLTAKFGNALCASLENMNHLKCLNVYSTSRDEILDLQNISTPPHLLQHLVLTGRMEKLPNWIPKLQNLVALGFNSSGLMEDPLKCLQHCLPNLLYLRLYQGYNGEKLHFEKGGFPKLVFLELRELNGLKEVKIDKGALPLLRKLLMGTCPLLKEMPSDIEHLENLKFLKVFDMPKEFVLGLQPNGGQHYWKVRHVPSILFLYSVKGEHYKIYKPGDLDLLEHLERLPSCAFRDEIADSVIIWSGEQLPGVLPCTGYHNQDTTTGTSW